MINEKIIKEYYSRMPDHQLIYLAQTEGRELTSEALVCLRNEFLQRNLDTAILEIVIGDNVEIKKTAVEKVDKIAHDEFMKSLWTVVFNEKESGLSNEAIYISLLTKGLSEEQATLIIQTIDVRAKQMLATHNADVSAGIVTCVTGLAIAIWTYSATANGTIYIIAWGAVLFGVIRFFKGISSKSRYKTILANIEAERIVAAQAATTLPSETITLQ